MDSVNKDAPASLEHADRRVQRRAARRADNRAGILDAAEQVFGQYGVRDGSLRQIALLSGFSTAGIYLFFENKEDLLTQVLTRRGTELVAVLRAAAEGDRRPIDKLHHVVDVTVAFFEARPHFRRLIRHTTGGPTIIGPTLAPYDTGSTGLFQRAMALLAGVVRDGQDAGEICPGDAAAVAHLFSVLVNEHVLLATEDGPGISPLTPEQFHGLVDGALRRPHHRDP
jgi:AcrR family transcriptional regulator